MSRYLAWGDVVRRGDIFSEVLYVWSSTQSAALYRRQRLYVFGLEGGQMAPIFLSHANA